MNSLVDLSICTLVYKTNDDDLREALKHPLLPPDFKVKILHELFHAWKYGFHELKELCGSEGAESFISSFLVC